MKSGNRTDQSKQVERSSIISNFTWGRVVDSYVVGPYFIVVYNPRIAENGVVSIRVDVTKLEYHPFILRSETGLPGDDCRIQGDTLYRDINHSYQTLDAALAGVIACHHEGLNHHADRYFIQALEAPALKTQLNAAHETLKLEGCL